MSEQKLSEDIWGFWRAGGRAGTPDDLGRWWEKTRALEADLARLQELVEKQRTVIDRIRPVKDTGGTFETEQAVAILRAWADQIRRGQRYVSMLTLYLQGLADALAALEQSAEEDRNE